MDLWTLSHQQCGKRMTLKGFICVTAFKTCQFDVYGSLRHYSTVQYLILHHGLKILKDEYVMLTNPWRNTLIWLGLALLNDNMAEPFSFFFFFVKTPTLKEHCGSNGPCCCYLYTSFHFCSYSANDLCLIIFIAIWSNMAFSLLISVIGTISFSGIEWV